MRFTRLDNTPHYGETLTRRRSYSLQGHFDEWEMQSARRAGTPEWLNRVKLRGTSHEQVENRWGFGFQPDAVGSDGELNYVFELKFAPKWEFAGLAEALHHAEELENGVPFSASAQWTVGKPIVAVVIGQWNAFHRAAVRRLRRAGVGPDTLRYIEVLPLGDSSEPPYLWFDEWLPSSLSKTSGGRPAHSLFEQSDPPSMLPAQLRDCFPPNFNNWYRRSDSPAVWATSYEPLDADGEFRPETERITLAQITPAGCVADDGRRSAEGVETFR